MKIVVIVLLTTLNLLADRYGVFPSPRDLHLNEDDYWLMISFLGIMCGSIVSFLITR